MSPFKSHYLCQSCGHSSGKWRGRCETCGQWNSFLPQRESAPQSAKEVKAQFEPLFKPEDPSFPRLCSGLGEFDRVCGGGLVAGSVSLVAGDPGIGKSTLLLQLACALSQKTAVIYVSGEESASQVRLRAQRLGLHQAAVHLMSTTYLEDVLTLLPSVLSGGPFKGFMIIDSIQTMTTKDMASAMGSVSQIRECMTHLITLAKSTGLSVMVVGHITKDGLIAGPKVLEHMVDTVLSFEGDPQRPYRLLRTIKNRFGSAHEVGVFDMTEQGLKEVPHPSALFLSARSQPLVGACTFAAMEGSRPLLVEFQALSVPSFLASPRRSAVGWDVNRLSMVLAVLEARCQWSFSKKDVFLTVLGGIKISEPCADLCVALALLSCLKKQALPGHTVAFGEIGLTGEVYRPCFKDQRLREAEHMGIQHVFMPGEQGACKNLTHRRVDHIKDLDLWG